MCASEIFLKHFAFFPYGRGRIQNRSPLCFFPRGAAAAGNVVEVAHGTDEKGERTHLVLTQTKFTS